MAKKVDIQSAELYRRLSADLVSYPDESRFPSFAKIRAHYGCTRKVLEQALFHLESEKQITVKPHRGIFVTRRKNLAECRVLMVHTDWAQEYQATLDARLEVALTALSGVTFTRKLVQPVPKADDFCRQLTRENGDIAIVSCNFCRFSQHDAARILGSEIPLIFLENHMACYAVNLIDSMPEYSGMIAAEYLLRNGHRKIALVLTDFVDLCLRRELDGFYRYLSFHHIVPELIDCRHPSCESSLASAEEKGVKYLTKNGLNFTGAFICSVFAAHGFYRALRTLGISIPDDVSLIANSEVPSAKTFDPPLTTVSRDIDGYVSTAIRMVQEIREGKQPGVVPVPSFLIERNSVRNLNQSAISTI